MKADVVPLIVAALVFFSSLVSLKLGLSVAIIEILFGAAAAHFGLKAEDWMIYVANFGGIILTFLAGTEIDARLLREKFKETFLIGFLSFLLPFIVVFLFTYYIAHWSNRASLIAGTALSTTSLAVVYSVLVETGLSKTHVGKMLMAATFITDIGTALVLSVLFVKPTIYTLVFVLASVAIIFFADRFSRRIFRHPLLKNKVIEPEIKYKFLLLIAFMSFANLGEGHAILPAFVLGLLMSKQFHDASESAVIRNRLKTVAYAFITPVFFIVGGARVSLSMITASMGLFAVLFGLKILSKFGGVYFLAKKFIPHGSMYTTLLMSTGLTFGTIASLFGLNSGLIDRAQYSVLVGVVIASAVVPTFIAQKWFLPVHSEDIIETNREGRLDETPAVVPQALS